MEVASFLDICFVVLNQLLVTTVTQHIHGCISDDQLISSESKFFCHINIMLALRPVHYSLDCSMELSFKPLVRLVLFL